MKFAYLPAEFFSRLPVFALETPKMDDDFQLDDASKCFLTHPKVAGIGGFPSERIKHISKIYLIYQSAGQVIADRNLNNVSDASPLPTFL